MNIPKPTSPFQESDRAAEIPSSNDVKMIKMAKLRNETDIPPDFLCLGNTDCSRNRNKEDNPKSDEQAIGLSRFVKKVSSGFLGVGIGGCSRNRYKEDNPKSDEQAIVLAKLRNEIDTPSDSLGLGNGGCSRNRNKEDNPKSDEQAIDLGKLRNEIDTPSDYLGLGNGDCSRNRNKESNPKSDEQAIGLGKFLKEIDTPSDFLGLGIDSSSNYKINRGRKKIALNPAPLRSYHLTHGYKDKPSDHHQARASCINSWTGEKRMREQNDDIDVKKGPKRSRVDEYPEPINPPREIFQKFGPNVKPVLLYRKELFGWDAKNRLFVGLRKKLMDFLTREGRVAVEDEKMPGVGLVGIAKMGLWYQLRRESFDEAVFNKGWQTILDANEPGKKWDWPWVHLWAFRWDKDGLLYLFVDFLEHP